MTMRVSTHSEGGIHRDERAAILDCEAEDFSLAGARQANLRNRDGVMPLNCEVDGAERAAQVGLSDFGPLSLAAPNYAEAVEVVAQRSDWKRPYPCHNLP
jgi:hypothetical protein